MDDSGFKSTRLSLMIISIGIIIYIFGDGTVNGANIFFGSLSLKDTTPVTYTAILIYIYMLWRYWLYRHEVTGNFGDEFKEYFYSHPDYASIALKVIDKIEDGEFKTNCTNAVLTYNYTHTPYFEDINRGEDNIKVRRYYYPLMLNSFLSPTHFYAGYEDSEKKYKTGSKDLQKLPKIYFSNQTKKTIDVDTLQYQCLELLVLSKMIFTKRTFADFFLPIPIALWAGYLLLTK